MRRYADMRENGVEKFASPLLIEALELDPPPPSSDNTSLGPPPPPPRKISESKPLCQFYGPFCSIFALCVCGGGGGCHNLILDKLGTQNE